MKKIALLYGGFSGEAEVSKKSANEIFKSFDREKYEPILVRIADKNWTAEINEEQFAIDKNDFTFLLHGEKVVFDSIFNIIHGTPGEDGKLSGYFDLLGLKHNSSGVLTSSLTFNKNWCNKFLSTYGITVPQSVVFYKGEDNQKLLQSVNFPSFVKPNNGGSSIGTHKVYNEEELTAAISDAFLHDSEVIVEEFIEGREFSCGILKKDDQNLVMPLTEIIPNSDFFDFTQKYSENGATEITPADLAPDKTVECQQIVEKVFHILRLKRVARIDFILKNDCFYLIEVNTIPGMSPKSILPQQAKHLGISFASLVNDYLMEC